jgi:hypothetical protein
LAKVLPTTAEEAKTSMASFCEDAKYAAFHAGLHILLSTPELLNLNPAKTIEWGQEEIGIWHIMPE